MLRNSLLVARNLEKQRAVLRKPPPVARGHKFLPSVLRNTLSVARRKIFSDGCPTDSAMPGQAFGRIGGKGPAGPTRAAVLRSRRTASVRRTLDRAYALTKRRSSPSQQPSRTSPPFPDVSPRACGDIALRSVEARHEKVALH